MEAFMLALLMLAAVLASSVIDQLVPKVSSPLIQIGLGLVIAVAAGGQIDIIFDDSGGQLFLVLFIAPLLYNEAKNADKAELWRNKVPVVSLAIGLVVVTALAIGFTVHWIEPSIGLAAAFALGAALGPTDPIAVASLSRGSAISTRAQNILKGESLINDASGIVAFQFALGAAVTGTFSLMDAAGEFLVEFFGGIAVGIALGLFGNFLVRKVRSWGLENTTFHVLFEVFTPFIVYLVADQLHTSGILAVVAAGLVNVISPRAIGPSVSRLNIVSDSVWRVLSFTLNGVVFVLLGTQLPRAMQQTWENVHIDNGLIIGYVLLATLVLIAVRFLWVLAMELAGQERRERQDRRLSCADLRSAAIMTLGGPKGAVTLAVILTLPRAIPQQQLIMFLACGVIVATLLLATFVIPLLAPTKAPSNEDARAGEARANLDILRSVIEELSARQTPENRAATQMVIHSYNERIARIKEHNGIDDELNVRLRLKALRWEQDYVTEAVESGETTPLVGYRYLARLSHTENLLERHTGRWSLHKTVARMRTVLRSTWHRVVRGLPGAKLAETTQALRDLQIKSGVQEVANLQAELASSDSAEKTEDVSTLLLEYQRALRSLRSATPSITAITTTADKARDIERMGLYLELEQIQTRYEAGERSRACAKRLRENVYLMQIDLEDNV